jgi:hypothetical protein
VRTGGQRVAAIGDYSVASLNTWGVNANQICTMVVTSSLGQGSTIFLLKFYEKDGVI